MHPGVLQESGVLLPLYFAVFVVDARGVLTCEGR